VKLLLQPLLQLLSLVLYLPSRRLNFDVGILFGPDSRGGSREEKEWEKRCFFSQGGDKGEEADIHHSAFAVTKWQHLLPISLS
jgi:hypothetical protein